MSDRAVAIRSTSSGEQCAPAVQLAGPSTLLLRHPKPTPYAMFASAQRTPGRARSATESATQKIQPSFCTPSTRVGDDPTMLLTTAISADWASARTVPALQMRQLASIRNVAQY